MKEVIVHPTPTLHTSIHNTPIPSPGPNELVIKVMVAGCNVKDWLHPTLQNLSLNSGDDLAGTVHEMGAEVERSNEFKVGDRVAAFHPMMGPHGAFAEFAVAPLHTVLKLPWGVGFEEAATLPLVLTTSAISLFRRQHLPPPWSPRPSSSPPLPLIIYGASSAVGTFALKLAQASNIHPITAIAGSSTTHLRPLLSPSKGDTLIDYRVGIQEMANQVREHLNHLPCFHALDCISAAGTWIPLSHLLSPSTPTQTSYLSVVSGANAYDEVDIQQGVQIVYTYVGTAHRGAYQAGMVRQDPDAEHVAGDPEWVYVLFRYVGRMLGDGRMSGHPVEVVEGGLLDGVEKGLRMLKEGRARGVKFVVRVGVAD